MLKNLLAYSNVDEGSERSTHLNMQDPARTDKHLEDCAIKQATVGDIIGARQTLRGIVDKGCQHDAWIAILGIQMDRRDVQGIKETIVACPDHSILRCLWYRDLPLYFYRAGDVAGAIEIANTMGDFGKFALALIPIGLATTGDFVGAREAVSRISDEVTRNDRMNTVDELQRKSETLEGSSPN